MGKERFNIAIHGRYCSKLSYACPFKNYSFIILKVASATALS